MSEPIHVVKLGGSLLDLPELIGDVLPRFLDAYVTASALLVIGGGRAADLVREYDRLHGLNETDGHWLAVRAMALNSHFVATSLNRPSRLVNHLRDAKRAWDQGDLAVVDPIAWLEEHEAAGFGVPHRWSFTSDSIAAHIATRVGAVRLTLLKSTSPQQPCDVAQAVAAGIVDTEFEQASRDVPLIDLINLRQDVDGVIRLK